ncbi:hypothetical protein KI387_022176, partial [Taxus chinensis]
TSAADDVGQDALAVEMDAATCVRSAVGYHARGGTQRSLVVQSDRQGSQFDGRPHREMGSGDQCVPSPDWRDDHYIGGCVSHPSITD